MKSKEQLRKEGFKRLHGREYVGPETEKVEFKKGVVFVRNPAIAESKELWNKKGYDIKHGVKPYYNGSDYTGSFYTEFQVEKQLNDNPISE